jgi:hypothetical protein
MAVVLEAGRWIVVKAARGRVSCQSLYTYHTKGIIESHTFWVDGVVYHCKDIIIIPRYATGRRV